MHHVHRRSLLGLSAGAVLVLTGLWGVAGTPAFAAPSTGAMPLVQAQQLGAPAPVNSTTRLNPILIPKAYGAPFLFSVTVELDAASNLSGQVAELWLNGENVGQTPLIYIGSGRFSGILATSQVPNAGEYSAVARFPGFEATTPTTAGALPSESSPYRFTVAPLASTTAVTAAPTAEHAFATVDVAASVFVPGYTPTGSASLMLDDTEIATAALEAATDPSAGSRVDFVGVRLPAHGETLWVRYQGSADGNMAPSDSVRTPIHIDPLDTSVDVRLDPSQIRADDTTDLHITVTNETLGSSQDPVGSVEVLIDGAVAVTMAQAQDVDPESGNGVSRYSVPLGGSELGLGTHDVTVQFLPEPGFTESSSEPVSLTVQGIPTWITSDVAVVAGTPAHPARVLVRASVDPAAGPASAAKGALRAAPEEVTASSGSAAAGYVQAFVAGEPLGDPVWLAEGAADVELRGLAEGRHDVEIRFTPTEDPNALKSSMSITAEITADAAPKPGPKPEPKPGPAPDPGPEQPGQPAQPSLAQTGAPGGHPWFALGAASVLLAASVLFAGSRRLSRHPRA
ncbi:Ig-like domain-containing protein [Leucobacter luti]|uniref:Ig-like domain-containing protein n=1 Tax=Leucobacter luti TaxID=340320 RepID=UPI001414D92C|nr:Ig-like domain-containing protein [Leucobacter luti]